MFHETKVKGKTKAKCLEVSEKMRTFANNESKTVRGCYARCGEYDESVYYILITNNFHEKTAIR